MAGTSVCSVSPTIFTWSSEFAARGIPDEEAKKFVEGFYNSGFEDLQKLFGGEE